VAAPRRIAALVAAVVTVGPLASGCGSTKSVTGTGPPATRPPTHFPRPLKTDWGDPPGGKPSGVLILIPGGGWKTYVPNYNLEVALAKSIRAGGLATVVVLYSPGIKGFREIEGVYEQARRRYPGRPICALGMSAGGHLALMLAARQHGLACVIDMAGPTDLATLGTQGAVASYQAAVEAFGKRGLRRWSPTHVARSIKAKVLMMYARNDGVVPYRQGLELKARLPSAELISFPAGSAGFMHSPVDAAALARANKRQEQFLATAIGAR
jgi:dienelactone hydrolase